MNMTNPKWRVIYAQIAPALALIIMLVALFGAVGTIYNDRTNRQQDRDRISDQAALLACFDRYTTASATTSKAVRDVSVKVSNAQTARDKALQAAFEYLATEPAEDDPRGLSLFADLLSTSSDLVQAQVELAKVRVDNPVPDPPSEFCGEEVR